MYAIDEAKKRFVAAEATLKTEHRRARGADPHDEGARGQPGRGAQGGRVGGGRPRARAGAALQAYDRRRARGMPAVVPIRGGKCGGCHLKVSSEVESAARGKARRQANLPSATSAGR